MTKKMKFQARRIIALAIIYLILGALVGTALGKSIDNDIKREEVMMKEHKELWQIK